MTLYHTHTESWTLSEGIDHPVRLGTLPLDNLGCDDVTRVQNLPNLGVLHSADQTETVGAEVEDVLSLNVLAEDESSLSLVVLEGLEVDDFDIPVQNIIDALVLGIDSFKRLALDYVIHVHILFHLFVTHEICVLTPDQTWVVDYPCAHISLMT